MILLQELLDLNESVQKNPDGVYKHPSGMCEVHVDEDESGPRARVIFRSVAHDDDDQMEICRKKYFKFTNNVFGAYGLNPEDANTGLEDNDGNATVFLDFPPME